ncbi:uncharacterized protein B0T23DRAFT_308188, partial [Neurospora hispaniola]
EDKRVIICMNELAISTVQLGALPNIVEYLWIGFYDFWKYICYIYIVKEWVICYINKRFNFGYCTISLIESVNRNLKSFIISNTTSNLIYYIKLYCSLYIL